MSIRVVCPNGHPLRVQDSSAGKTGLCPVCKALVKVPEPANYQPVSEDDVLGFLGPQPVKGPHSPSPVEHGPARPGVEGPLPPKKSCERCNQEILATTHVCPYCHTYVGGASLL